jgi:hypothetical protein
VFDTASNSFVNNITKWIVAKNRHGQTGCIEFEFDSMTTRINEISSVADKLEEIKEKEFGQYAP